MSVPAANTLPDQAPQISCSQCPAVCCQLKVLLIAGDDPPEHYIDLDEDGHEIMGKGDDGWCAALDRDAMQHLRAPPIRVPGVRDGRRRLHR